jgi:hypothetical protein
MKIRGNINSDKPNIPTRRPLKMKSKLKRFLFVLRVVLGALRFRAYAVLSEDSSQLEKEQEGF